MAQYQITHQCGHASDTIQLFGPERGRQDRLAYLRAQPCELCRSQRAQDAAAASGLAPLTGSAKQIAWAADIRARALGEVDSILDKARAQAAAIPPELLAARDALAAEGASRWWIDNRDAGTKGLLRAKASLLVVR